MKKEKEKTEQKINMHHVDHVPINELDVLIKTEREKDTNMCVKEKKLTEKTKMKQIGHH